MKRFVLVLGAFLAAVLSALAWWTGDRTQHAWSQLMADLAQVPEVAIYETTFQRGWLHSDAVLGLELRGTPGSVYRKQMEDAGHEGVRSRVGLRLETRLEHGPLALWDWLQTGANGLPSWLHALGILSLDRETRDELMPLGGRLPELALDLHLRADGLVEVLVNGAPATFGALAVSGAEPSWQVRWLGLAGAITCDASGDVCAGQLGAPSLEIDTAARQRMLSGAQLNLEWQRDDVGLRVGETRLSIARLGSVARSEAAAEEKRHDAALADVELAYTASVSNGQYHAALRAGVGRIGLDGGSAGPASAELALRGIDANALARHRLLAPPFDADGVFSAALAGRPVLDLSRFELATPAGPIRGQAHARLASATSGGDEPLPGIALEEGAVELRVPEALVAALLAERKQPLEPLVERGLLVRDDGSLTLRLTATPAGWRAGEANADAAAVAGLRQLAADALVRGLSQADATTPVPAAPGRLVVVPRPASPAAEAPADATAAPTPGAAPTPAGPAPGAAPLPAALAPPAD